MSVLAVAMSLVALPLALVAIAVDVPESAFPMCLVVPPESFVPRAIWPNLDALAMAHVVQPLAIVACTAIKDEF